MDKKRVVIDLARQSIEAKEDHLTLHLINTDTKYDEQYLNSLILKAKTHWKNINPDEWLHDLRGDYDT